MSDAYRKLLDAAIEHLESLKAHGVGNVRVTTETLSALTARVAAVQAPQASATGAGQPSAQAIRPVVERSTSRTVAPPSASAISRWSKAAAPMTPAKKPSELLPPALSRPEKEAALAELRAQALACIRCPNLAASRNTVVFGVGDVDARILFVGEAPGADEDLRGEPFVGKAGELLTKIIVAMGLTRETVFIANILKCRPDTPGQTSGNRKPRTDEMETCIPWLEQQIRIIRPQAMVALGATAVEGLLGKNPTGITRLRGTWQEYRGIPVMPTYHPAYLLRNQAITEKRKVWEDMMLAMERVGYPVSTKQRGFFLTKG